MLSLELIHKYYAGQAKAKSILLAHSRLVADFAVTVTENYAQSQSVDMAFVEQAAMLHDIGMIYTDTPKLGCFGNQPYITHGILGADLLRKEGLPRHALVCERHIGVGLSIEDIKRQNLPLPLRDMRPQSVEEEIIAYADLFFSKTTPGQRNVDQVRTSLARHGEYKVAVFNQWHKRFHP